MDDVLDLSPLPHRDPKNCRNGRHRYSLLRAIDGAVGPLGRNPLGSKPDGLEREVSDELARRSGRAPQGFFAPADVFLEHRSLTTTTGAGSITTILAGFAEVLRPAMVLGSAGARIENLKPGLDGKLGIPRGTAASPTSWVDEDSAPTAGAMAIDQVVFEPCTVGATTDCTRRMIKSAGDPNFEAFVLADIAKSIAQAVDAAGLNGSGAGGVPRGFFQTTGVPTIALATDGGAASRAALIAMESAVGVANGDTADASLAWITSPQGRASLRGTDGSTGNSGRWLWPDSNLVLGRPAFASTNVPSTFTKGAGTDLTGLAYGNWKDLIINLFTSIDILANPFLQTLNGCVRLQSFLDCDVQLLHTGSFAKIVDLSTP